MFKYSVVGLNQRLIFSLRSVLSLWQSWVTLYRGGFPEDRTLIVLLTGVSGALLGENWEKEDESLHIWNKRLE